ncbi:MAG TPA: hypothetical protein VNO33_11115, partial [Kofleriaceae bacterium]|nr:hypothetical protein [Kofleriaceae bacterium]
MSRGAGGWSVVTAVLAAALSSCADPEPPAKQASPAPPAADAAPAPAARAPVPPPPYPAEIRSLRLRRSIAVRLEPAAEAKRLGTVAQDTRVGFRGARVAPGCEGRWIEIEPRGWVCDAFLEPTRRAPDGVELPRLARGELVPGAYGKALKKARIVTWNGRAVTGERALQGSATVRRYDEAMIRGVPHWRIAPGEYVPASAIEPHVPS